MKMLLTMLVVLVSFTSIISLYSSAAGRSSQEVYLEYHNNMRRLVSSPPLRWNLDLKRQARKFLYNHSIDCLGSKPLISSGIGWNLAREWGNGTFLGIEAVFTWFFQKEFYDHVANKCVGGECRSYTQLVWSRSTDVGCFRVKCHNDIGTLVRCNYHPPGNIPGERPF
ncbi:hypothetical protein PIB30_045422 [Stylosanthes scabra]|uniref:SCP domain-containing protein n=1 Tax=Stylosanthes scabra TaxID=79078 RepID=A0ABU6QGS0_9FABA|nr:hypothetical protein [Stylosanthes scabra]